MLGILLRKNIALEGSLAVNWSESIPQPDWGKVRPYLLAVESLLSLIHSDTTESLTSRGESVRSRT
jgi:hypothetical protein